MNEITPKEAIANLNHIYGMVSPDIQRSLDVAIKALERPQGDLISRDALKEAIKANGYSHYFEIFDIIDNAQAIPQVTVFTENADEKAIADLKSELQNVIEARPNEQIAWEQGYEAGLAQGKQGRPQGEWIDRMADKGYVECPFCGKEITGGDLNFCVKCGADMRGGAE